jgi:hypothetical protein
MAGAIEVLMLVVELGGPTMFARIGVMRGIEPVSHKDRSVKCSNGYQSLDRAAH